MSRALLLIALFATVAIASASCDGSDCSSCVQNNDPNAFPECNWCLGNSNNDVEPSCENWTDDCPGGLVGAYTDQSGCDFQENLEDAAGMALGIIIAIIVGVVVGIIICVCLCIYLCKPKQPQTVVVTQAAPAQ
mmetsp:Transcript_56361/g.136194  ORF Transcript_56361/g.136194 Transcript_56361/m.136194 type:complete len:134 (+) Transcript_56361:30-431(+)